MNDKRVVVVGLGYVGLTLAVTLADLGFQVWGYDRDQCRISTLGQSRSPFYEPGVEDLLQRHLNGNLKIGTSVPQEIADVIIICVSTPVGKDQTPDLENLRAAVDSIGPSLGKDTLVILRSTVPVGTTRNLVLPGLQKWRQDTNLAFCPERTIQGRAIQELKELPQVVGGIDASSGDRAGRFWDHVTSKVVLVGSPESAEMVKLINNCHTDLNYAFGNEVALMAHRWGLDPLELINAANEGYPRASLARPGFVGGACLTKDPYLLIHSFAAVEYRPNLVADSRGLNELLPGLLADHFLKRLSRATNDNITGSKTLLCGFAYKGWPVTDDQRGAPVWPILDALSPHQLDLWGHDYTVSCEVIAGMDVKPTGIDEGFREARAVLLMTEHPQYRELHISELASRMHKPALIYDCWRLFNAADVESVDGVAYAGIGYG